jgi:hypothetical protein
MKKNYLFNNIFHISLLLFFIKWFFFFNISLETDLLTKLIFRIEDWQYFISIFNLSNLDFNPTYASNFTDLKFIPIPIYSIIYHSFFVNFFGIYGFIIIEFFIILFFFHILFNFFKLIGVDKIQAIFLTLLIFCLPNLIDYFQLDKIQYLGIIKELYSLRIPRPSISHLYLFSFFLLLASNNKKSQFKYTQLVFIGLIFALMLGSYYYNLAITGITFVMYYFYITFQSNQKIFKHIKDVAIVSFFFILFSSPLILILFNSEPDHLVRVGLVELDFFKKKILFTHFKEQFLSIKFLLVFVLITLLYLFLKNKKHFKTEIINLLYFTFLGSILGPLFFILLSTTISEAYHFTNMIVAINFFILLTFSFLTILTLIKSLSWNKNLFKLGTLFILLAYTFTNYSLAKNDFENGVNFPKVEQENFNELVATIKKINLNKESKILTFDGKLQTYLVLNEYINLIYVDGIMSSLNDERLENNIINVFKFLNLKQTDFHDFIKNKKSGWRFINSNIGSTFYMKYQANKLTTYKDSDDFSSEELMYISKSSPLHSQQLIIPAFEIKRLTNKFTNFSKKKDLNPDLIIININDPIEQKAVLDDSTYCSKVVNNTYLIYFNKKTNPDCR